MWVSSRSTARRVRKAPQASRTQALELRKIREAVQSDVHVAVLPRRARAVHASALDSV